MQGQLVEFFDRHVQDFALTADFSNDKVVQLLFF